MIEVVIGCNSIILFLRWDLRYSGLTLPTERDAELVGGVDSC